jgi:hypothetical protein
MSSLHSGLTLETLLFCRVLSIPIFLSCFNNFEYVCNPISYILCISAASDNGAAIHKIVLFLVLRSMLHPSPREPVDVKL